MPSGYVPIFIFLALAIAFPIVLIVAAKLIRPSAPFSTKLEPYECGIKPVSDSRGRYTVRFYIIAILFVIFDVETVFLIPWAVRYRALGWFGVAEVAVFLAILIVGYIWAYKKGALDWVWLAGESACPTAMVKICRQATGSPAPRPIGYF